jgi:DNA-3-methyladenine glycosylase I
MADKSRCPWCQGSELERHYHDTEWGVPLRDDRKLFEFVLLDGFQAGLSWKTILLKRENYRKALFDFDPERLATCGPADIAGWMQDAGMVRNRLKMEGVPKNAQAFLRVQAEYGSFSRYIWQFTEGQSIRNAWTDHSQIPSVSPQALAMSKDMKKRGFTFCGPTICYAFMQAAGMVNDHLVSCFRYKEVQP